LRRAPDQRESGEADRYKVSNRKQTALKCTVKRLVRQLESANRITRTFDWRNTDRKCQRTAPEARKQISKDRISLDRLSKSQGEVDKRDLLRYESGLAPSFETNG
jgi:hypothetical protein